MSVGQFNMRFYGRTYPLLCFVKLKSRMRQKNRTASRASSCKDEEAATLAILSLRQAAIIELMPIMSLML